MKKLLIILTSAALLFSCTACGNNAELEALRKENKNLKRQLSQSVSTAQTTKPIISPDLELLNQQKSPNDNSVSEYVTASFTVKNNTNQDINTITLNIKELDENNNIISTTAPQEIVTVSPGQSITIKSISDSNVYALQLDSFSYYEGTEMNIYKQGQFPKDMEKLILK